jgi:hypothetical protein
MSLENPLPNEMSDDEWNLKSRPTGAPFTQEERERLSKYQATDRERWEKMPHIPVSGTGSREESPEDKTARLEMRSEIVAAVENTLDTIRANNKWDKDPETFNAVAKLYRFLEQYHVGAGRDPREGTQFFHGEPRKSFTLDREEQKP